MAYSITNVQCYQGDTGPEVLNGGTCYDSLDSTDFKFVLTTTIPDPINWDFEYSQTDPTLGSYQTAPASPFSVSYYHDTDTQHLYVRGRRIVGSPLGETTNIASFSFKYLWDLPSTRTTICTIGSTTIVNGGTYHAAYLPVTAHYAWPVRSEGFDRVIAKVFHGTPATGQYFGYSVSSAPTSTLHQNVAAATSTTSLSRSVTFYDMDAENYYPGVLSQAQSVSGRGGLVSVGTVKAAVGDVGGAYVFSKNVSNVWSADNSGAALSGSAVNAMVSVSRQATDNYCVVCPTTGGAKVYYSVHPSTTWDTGYSLMTGNFYDAAVSVSSVEPCQYLALAFNDGTNVVTRVFFRAAAGNTWSSAFDINLFSSVVARPVALAVCERCLVVANAVGGSLGLWLFKRTGTNTWAYVNGCNLGAFTSGSKPSVSFGYDDGTSALTVFASGSPGYGTATINAGITSITTTHTGSMIVPSPSDPPSVAFLASPISTMIVGDYDDDEKAANAGAVKVCRFDLDTEYRRSSGAAWSSSTLNTSVNLSCGSGPIYFGARGNNGYNVGDESVFQFTIIAPPGPSSESSTSSISMTSSSQSSSTSSRGSSLSYTTLLSLSTQSKSSLSSLSSSSMSSPSSSSISPSSLSSSSTSSMSSSSSDFGHLDTPQGLTIDSINPATSEADISWYWATYDHWGRWVTPTGLIVERKIGSGAWTTLTFSIPPKPEPSSSSSEAHYFYTDTLSAADAVAVFAWGQQLSYRVRVFWIV